MTYNQVDNSAKVELEKAIEEMMEAFQLYVPTRKKYLASEKKMVITHDLWKMQSTKFMDAHKSFFMAMKHEQRFNYTLKESMAEYKEAKEKLVETKHIYENAEKAYEEDVWASREAEKQYVKKRKRFYTLFLSVDDFQQFVTDSVDRISSYAASFDDFHNHNILMDESENEHQSREG